MKRPKHKNDQNHCKQGWIAGNPRYGRNNGCQKRNRPAVNQKIQKDIHFSLQDLQGLANDTRNVSARFQPICNRFFTISKS